MTRSAPSPPIAGGLHYRLARGLTLASYFGLLILLWLWDVWLYPSRAFPVALVLIVMVVPLLFPLRGLLHGKPYTHAWTSFLALPYFLHGVGTIAADPPERLYGALEILFSVLLFTGTVYYVRVCGTRNKTRR